MLCNRCSARRELPFTSQEDLFPYECKQARSGLTNTHNLSFWLNSPSFAPVCERTRVWVTSAVTHTGNPLSESDLLDKYVNGARVKRPGGL